MTTSLGWLLIVLAGSFTKTVFGGQTCEDPDRLVVCHVETTLHPATDPCYCTHLVIHKLNDAEVLKTAKRLREKNHRLKILSLSEEGKKGLAQDDLSGVYLRLSKSLSKEQVVKNVKTLATELDNLQASKRANAKYGSDSTEDTSKGIAEILLELPSLPEQLAKNYDLKSLNKYVNYFIITSDNLTDSSEEGMAYHPSRLMGIDDILNADSLVDLISGLGAEHEKLIISLPATALKFNLKDPKDNMPRAKVTAPPVEITQQELCSFIENGVWTLERDEDLTAPYAYSNTTWLAFDDSISAAIKAKYILLRGLAGISVTKSEADDWNHSCASRPILDTIYSTFTNLVRKPRAATLLSLQDQIHNSITPFAGDVQLSPFRIVRVVDRAGSIHVVRKEAKTEFQCSRQGYFTHPSGCNRFYRCVKFNQYSSDFTVFEYDCPAGLAFDERYEVCVWPGSLPDASACKGSSEIAPVPRSRYACSAEGYFADPENCRWFFACLDHRGDGSPPTAYEFRCPFGLVFHEGKLACDWPWSVPGCGSGSGVHSSAIYPGDILEGRLRPAYAEVSDVHVSGGRIANVDGGLVLGTNLLSGISTSGQRYSNGYSLGLANQINSAFGNSEYGDNSGAYIHDPTGDTGGEYIHQEGPNGPETSYYAGKGTSYASLSGTVSGSSDSGDIGGEYIHQEGPNGPETSYYAGKGTSYASLSGTVSGSSEQYFQDSRKQTGGYYVQDSREQNKGHYVQDSRENTGSEYVGTGDFSGSTSYATSSGEHDGQYATGDISVYGTGSSEADNSGGYVHDSRGDTGGAYIHQEGPGGPGSRPYLSSGSSSISSGSAGSVSSAGHSNAYVHDSRGETGGQYIHEIGTSGPSLVAYSGAKTAGIDYSGLSGTKIGVGFHQSELNGEQAIFGSKAVNTLSSGAYIHDSRGDTGGAYIHQEGPSGPGSVPYIHQVEAYRDRGFSDGSDIKTGDGYISNFVGGQNLVGLGGYTGGSYSTGSASGQYIHQSAGDTGATYIHQKLPSYYSGIYAHRYSGDYIHDNSGAYVHDTTGDKAEPYIHREGPSGPSGPIYQDLNINNIYNSQYAGQYASKYATDHRYITSYGNVNTAGAQLYQPQAGIIHTYDSSRLHVHPVGYVKSNIKPLQQTVFTTQNVSPIRVTQFSGVPQNPVQYISPISSNHQISVSTPSPAILTEIKSQNIRPITVTKQPAIPLNPVQYVSPLSYQSPTIKTQTVSPLTVSSTPVFGVKTHVVQPYQVSTPSPIISYETPIVRTQTVRPITVTSSPVIPLNPIKYEQPISVLKPVTPTYESYGVSSVSAPVIKTQTSHSVKLSQPVIHTQDISLNYPQVAVTTPATPIASYDFKAAIGSARPFTVTSAPVIPFNPVQYGQKSVTSTVYSGYDYPKPQLNFNYPQHIIKTQPILESKPVFSYSYHPSVSVSTVVNQPVIKTNVVSPAFVSTTPRPEFINYEVPVIKTQKVKPITVTSSPVVPLNSVQYGTKIQPIAVSTPATPISDIHFYNPVIKTQTLQPIIVSSTPSVPLNPVQYGVKTISSAVGYQYSKPLVGFSYPKNFAYSTQAPPVISYTYQKPLIKTQPIQPVSFSTPAPPVVSYSYQQPIKPAAPISISTPAPPVINYSYKQPIQPIIVSSTPAVPLNPVQYVKHISYSTPAPPVVDYSYKQPLKPVAPISFSTPSRPVVSYSYQQPIKPAAPISISTPAPPVINYSYKQPIQPIIVSSTPAVPLNPVQYVKHISYSTPAPPVVDYSYKQPLKPVAPLSFSTPAPPVINYSYQQPLKPVAPISFSTPSRPVVSYSYQQPIKPAAPISISTPTPPVINYSYKQPIQPIIVSSTPAVPLNPVQYVKHVSYSTPAPPVVDYSYKQPLKPVAPISFSTPSRPVVSYSYQQPINPAAPISFSTPAPPVINYSYKQPIQPIIVSSTPAVPLNPVQYVKHISYSTPAPPVVDYSYKQPLKPVAPISYSTPAPPVVSYSYQQPIKPAAPISFSTPAPPVVNYSYKQPIQPIIVSSTPAVPLNPVQYVKHVSYSTPAPPVVDYSYKQPLKPVAPISFSTPSRPVVSYSYQQPIKPAAPISFSTPAPPVINYSYKQPIQPIIVSSTPAVPLNPVQYVKHISYSTPAPPVVDYSYKQPLKPVAPISFSTPSRPVVSYSYQQPIKPAAPISFSTPAPPVVNYSYKQPIQPIIVSSTPAVPLNPVQYVKHTSYSTPAPPVVDYSYKQPLKPVAPLSFSTPAPPVINYSYKQPIQPIIVSSTPAVPLNPVQYVKHVSYSTPAPPVVDYSYKQPLKPVAPISFSTPSRPVVSYSYQQPIKPAAPISISTPAPPVINYSYQQPLKPAPFSFSIPSAPAVSYSVKTKPELQLTISSTPAPPLNPVQYVKPPRPLVDYSYQAPLKPVQYVKSTTVSTPVSPIVNYEYKQSVQPFTTSAPSLVDYTYNKPIEQYAVNKASNVVFSYSFEAKPIQPISVSSTPVVPLNPVQYSIKPSLSYLPASTYSTPAPAVNYSYRRPTIKPIAVTNQPTIVTSSAPKLSYSYQEEPNYFIKTKTVRPIAVSSTPVVPLNPVQYISTTPRPVINYKYQNPVIKAHTSIVSPPVVDYYDEEILHRDIIKIPPKPIVSSFYEVPTRTTTLAPITVTSTPTVPLNPVQYVKQSLPSFSYKYEQPQVATYNTKGCCSSPSIKVSTQPDILKTPVTPPTIISSTRKPVVGAYFEENYEANRNEQGYVYSNPNIKFEDKPFNKQGIYTTLSPVAISAEVTSSPHLQRPVQTYANTVEEESYISNTPEHVATFVKQPISVDTSDENLNLHLDIPKIGVSRPVYTTSSTPQQQIVEVTTVTPVVKRVRINGGSTRGGYYVRRQKVKVQPVLTTTENYPAYFTSTIKPIYSSTIDLTSPTLYSTTVRPSTFYTTSSTTTLKDNELELEDDDDRLLAQVSGQFGEIINAGNQGIIRQGVSSTTVSSLKDGETIVGVVKKERGQSGRNKAKVVVVSKLSDFNPLLVGKLGAECSCKSNSKTLNLQRGSSQTRGQLFYPQAANTPTPSRGYLPSSSDLPKVNDYYLPSSEVPLSDAITSTTIASASYEDEPFVEIKPINKVRRLYTTTGSSVESDSGEYDITTKRSIIKNRIGVSQEKTLSKGASFDRYGPGGLRGSDETLQGSVDCQRPGLFRHPKYCNKFYACNWDQWKKRFTLHVFNCPIHLAYDSQLGACNWPSKGPACADDNLLV